MTLILPSFSVSLVSCMLHVCCMYVTCTLLIFQVVANYFGKDKEYKEVEGKHIHWAGGRTSAPPDTPKCGFDGSKCPPKSKYYKCLNDNRLNHDGIDTFIVLF